MMKRKLKKKRMEIGGGHDMAYSAVFAMVPCQSKT